jgi:asparagine synthase (glutamine-hydrolysing)
VNPGSHAGLGSRRLSIIDLSNLAAQPMHYMDRYTIVHNGEIYNYIELRQTLQNKGYRFHSRSDTEVILAAYDCYKGDVPQYLDGMFAFAIWDESEQTLFAARDRFGEKPFYYWHNGKELVFASEMKALWAAGIPRQINNELLIDYLALGNTRLASSPEKSLYTGILDLPPASCMRFSYTEQKLLIKKYWSIDRRIKKNLKDEQVIDTFQQLFSRSVKRRLRSDVSVGTSLSGGLDSSSIVASIHQQQSGESLKTFSCIFPGFERDESHFIKEVSAKFGTDQYYTSPTANDFIRDIEKMLFHQEELISSASVYIQYKVFELARENGVKVLLDGQGADEILAGYTKYLHWYLQELVVTDPMNMKTALHALRKNELGFEWGWKNYFAAWLPSLTKSRLEKSDIQKIRSHPFLKKEFVGDTIYSSQKPKISRLNDILYFNTFRFGLEELLRFADRNSMAHGREARLPFLQHELVEFMFSLPSRFKIRDGWTKWLLRQAMASSLPPTIAWRKDKTGFDPPQRLWMQQKKMQSYIYEAKKKLVKNHILDKEVLQKKIQPLDTHAADNFDWRYLMAGSLFK